MESYAASFEVCQLLHVVKVHFHEDDYHGMRQAIIDTQHLSQLDEKTASESADESPDEHQRLQSLHLDVEASC